MKNNKTQSSPLKKQFRKEAMERISSNYPLTKEMMKKYQDELNWTLVSRNPNINWTVGMIKAFDHHIDWKVFSKYADGKLLFDEVIEQFKDKWDWNALSSNTNINFTIELLEKYFDRWDLSIVIQWRCWDRDIDSSSFDLLKRIRDLLPVDYLENTGFWDAVLDKEVDEIIKEMLLNS